MTVLVRKVEPAAWKATADGIHVTEVAADFVFTKNTSREIATERCTLSFWRFDPTTRGWEDEAALAIAGGWKTINDGLYIVVLEENIVRDAGIALRESAGETRVDDLRDHHVDAEALDIGRLNVMAKIIADTIRNAGRVVARSRGDLLTLLANAAEARRLQLAQLPKDLQAQVSGHLNSRKQS